MSEELSITGRTVMVPFDGTQIMVIDDGDKRPVVMKPFVEGIGLDWVHARAFLNNDAVLKRGARYTPSPTTGGVQNMMTLDMKYIPLFLAKLNPSRYSHKPELQARLVKYQVECADVLYQYFTQGFAVSDRISADDLERISKMAVAQKRRIEDLAGDIVKLHGDLKAMQCELGKKTSQVNELVERNDRLVVNNLNNASLIKEQQATIEEQKALLDDYRPKGEPPEGATLVHSHWRNKPQKKNNKAVSTPCQQPPPCPPTVVPHPESQVVVERNDERSKPKR